MVLIRSIQGGVGGLEVFNCVLIVNLLGELRVCYLDLFDLGVGVWFVRGLDFLLGVYLVWDLD